MNIPPPKVNVSTESWLREPPIVNNAEKKQKKYLIVPII